MRLLVYQTYRASAPTMNSLGALALNMIYKPVTPINQSVNSVANLSG